MRWKAHNKVAFIESCPPDTPGKDNPSNDPPSTVPLSEVPRRRSVLKKQSQFDRSEVNSGEERTSKDVDKEGLVRSESCSSCESVTCKKKVTYLEGPPVVNYYTCTQQKKHSIGDWLSGRTGVK